MKVNVFIANYPPGRMVGADLMSASILESLVNAGDEVNVYTDVNHEAYIRNGVHVYSRSEFNRTEDFADVIYSHPDLGPMAFLVSEAHRTPYVGMVHNTGSTNSFNLNRYPPHLTVWNSAATRQAHDGEGGLILRSPLVVKDHKVKPGKAVTLINCSTDKGVDTFMAVAKALPEADFLAVEGGYAEQRVEELLALDIPPMPQVQHEDMPTSVWSKTKVLLMPSVDESWGRVGAEAMCSGIPVIAHPTEGLKECLGNAGIYIDRDDHDAWIKEVARLLEDKDYYAAASKRATARAKAIEKSSATDLINFRTALIELIDHPHAHY